MPLNDTVAVSVSSAFNRWFLSPVALVSAIDVMVVGGITGGGAGGGGVGVGVTGVSLPPPLKAITPSKAPETSAKPIPAATGAAGKSAITLPGLSKATLQSSASSRSVQTKLSGTSSASLGKCAVT